MRAVADLAGIVEAAVLHPGDRLIIRLQSDTTMRQLDELATDLRARMPDVDFVLVAGAEQFIVQPREVDRG